MRRPVLGLLMVAISSWLLAGCGVSYPGDRPDWAMTKTPNEITGGIIGGGLTFLETGDARLLESLTNNANDQLRQVVWSGTWEGGHDGAEATFSCSDATLKNVDGELDCATATLALSCDFADGKLDCGAYGFQ